MPNAEVISQGKIMYPLFTIEDDGSVGDPTQLFFDYATYCAFHDIDGTEPVSGQIIPARNPRQHAEIELIDGPDSGHYCVPFGSEKHVTLPVRHSR